MIKMLLVLEMWSIDKEGFTWTNMLYVYNHSNLPLWIKDTVIPKSRFISWIKADIQNLLGELNTQVLALSNDYKFHLDA